MIGCGAGGPTETAPPVLTSTPIVLVLDVPSPVPTPTPDFQSIRLRVGALSREEIAKLDPALVERWGAFIGGDDSAYRALDERVIDALRTGQTGQDVPVYEIGGTLLTGVEDWGAESVQRIGYLVFDHQTGEPTVVAWVDEWTGNVVETGTGYRLNVLDPPGEWISSGPNGEQFYHYGYSYYRLWRRVLPDPAITMIQGFQTGGAQHVWRHLAEYQQAAEEYDDGDMTLIAWDDTAIALAAAWLPDESAPPTLILPDSGSIDVRRERFLEAVTTGRVTVDRDSVWDFMQSSRWENGYLYSEDITDQQIVDALLTPYRSGHLFSDLEAAIILAATYAGEEPLTIHISERFLDGAGVPRGGRKDVYLAAGEVADVILGYSGTMNARWGHEMAHVLEFRDTRNEAPVRRRGQASRCEPLKYMMEYMWWVERYPHDAPDWDWMPVGSGLTLARLLTGTYPNSGC